MSATLRVRMKNDKSRHPTISGKSRATAFKKDGSKHFAQEKGGMNPLPLKL
jgi:hypothetical protein